MTGFAPQVQVKRFIAEVNGALGTRWRVFTTGDDRFYLFVMTRNSDVAIPVRKTDLRTDVRRALAHGYGHPTPRDREG